MKQPETLVEKLGSSNTSCFSVDSKETLSTIDRGGHFLIECEIVDGYLAKQGFNDRYTIIKVYQSKCNDAPEFEVEGEHFSVGSFKNLLIGQYATIDHEGNIPLSPSTLDLLLASSLPEQVKNAILEGEEVIKRHKEWLEKLGRVIKDHAKSRRHH